MREKGKKTIQNHTNINFSAPDSICKIHLKSPPIGICPICLREKLKNLICSVCGEQNTFFSCSCSDLTRNSISSDVGSVGRISFLIENENQMPIYKNNDFEIDIKKKQRPGFKIPFLIKKPKPISENTQFSNPDYVHEEGIKKSGILRLRNIFKKKRDNKGYSERNSEVWIFDHSGVSRSRSLCSFRESSSEFAFSTAKNSDFNSSSERVSNFSEPDPRKTSFENKGMRMKNMEDMGYIDLKIGEENCESGNMRRGGSCRITKRETNGARLEKKGKKVWGWILKHNSSWRIRSSNKDDHVKKT